MTASTQHWSFHSCGHSAAEGIWPATPAQSGAEIEEIVGFLGQRWPAIWTLRDLRVDRGTAAHSACDPGPASRLSANLKWNWTSRSDKVSGNGARYEARNLLWCGVNGDRRLPVVQIGEKTRPAPTHKPANLAYSSGVLPYLSSQCCAFLALSHSS
jgi:hypothetical protein